MRAPVLVALLVLMGSPALAGTCSERITFVRDVIDRDLKTGFIGKGVYEQMTADLAAAETACKAGDAGKANALVTATQNKHGYPVR